MTTYRASVTVDDDTLHTARPLTAPDEVRDLVDWTVDRVVESGGKLTRVELEFETAGESDTPIGDGVVGTSSTPLHPDSEDEVDEPRLPGEPVVSA